MPTRHVWVDAGAAGSGKVPVDVIERGSDDIFTTTTESRTTGDTTVAVADRTLGGRAPSSGNFKARWEKEVVLVTGGHGSGAGSFTITRQQDGTAAAAHASGTVFAQVVGIQRVENVDSKQVTFKGRISTFRTPGRAGTAGQKILAAHTATASTILLDIDRVEVHLIQAAAAGVAPTVIAPIVRLWKFTALPTNGTTLAKVPLDSAYVANAGVTA